MRLAMLFSKALFIFFAAKYLELSELGIYSLIGASIAYAIYVLGLDFYTFTTRTIIGMDKSRADEVIVELLRFCILSYLFFFLPILSVFLFDIIPWTFSVVFFLILFCEFISQELTRVLIAIEKTLTATFILLVRTSAWCYFLVVLFIIDERTRTVNWVLFSWFVSSFISVVLAFYVLRFVPWKKFLFQPIPFRWIFNGLAVAFPMLISTLALRGLFTLDKLSVEYLGTLSMLGVYSVYIAVCNALLSFMDAAVIQFKYPLLVKSVNLRDQTSYIREFKKFTKQVLFFLAIGVVAFIVLANIVFSYLGKPEYIEEIRVLWWLILVHVILILSFIPHYALFALRKDRVLMLSHILGLSVFVIALTFVKYNDVMMGVALSLVAGVSSIFLVKSFVFHNYFRKINSLF